MKSTSENTKTGKDEPANTSISQKVCYFLRKLEWKAVRLTIAFLVGAGAGNIDRVLDKLIYPYDWAHLIKELAKFIKG